VDEQHLPARQPHNQVLAAALHRLDALAGQPRRRPGGVVGPRQPRVVDSRGRDPPPFEPGREPLPLGLDFRQLGHG
jgi:hypothetical protein